jgi:hypothetical protein
MKDKIQTEIISTYIPTYILLHKDIITTNTKEIKQTKIPIKQANTQIHQIHQTNK